MSEREAPALFESFNARNLAPEQIAQTFVPPDSFQQLVGQHHTLVLGPRGSGKTTLLKMLQQQALDAWRSPIAEAIRGQLKYTSVYIATDISWGKQVAALGGQALDDSTRNLLATASFTTQILRRLVDVMFYLSRHHDAYQMDAATEHRVATQIALTCELGSGFVSLMSVKYELGRRLSRIHQLASQEALLGPGGRPDRLAADRGLHLSFLPCCGTCVDIFNDAVDRPAGRWALLLDELELAPRAIREYLLNALRSVDERFLFKLSLVPFGDDVSGFAEALSAQPGQDFEVIRLWYAHKDDGSAFCRQLWESMLRARQLPVESPEYYLGRSVFDTERSEWAPLGTAYRKGSALWKRFLRLAGKDPTFRDFLSKEGIRLDSLEALPPDRRAETLRKATSIVALRDAFVAAPERQGQEAHLRTRKVLDVYTGADALFAITEGNPRWFKGIVGPLLDSTAPGRPKIQPVKQSRQIEKAISRFRSLLRTVPSPSWKGKQSSRGLLSLLDAIGYFFRDRLLFDKFTLDPLGTFTVDARTSDALISSLGTALNSGAIVSMEDLDFQSAALRGKRFRLSYLLAPYYRISLRLERSLSLSKILDIADSSPDASLFDLGETDVL
jgi:hypothetical protein